MNNNYTILIVEDDVALRQLYEKRYSLAGFKVLVATDGEEGLEKANSYKPDIVLLDILLPKESGIVVMKKLKNDIKTKKIPIIIMTAYDIDQYRLESQPYCEKFFLKSDIRPVDMVNQTLDVLEK